MPRRKPEKKHRGVYEKVKGSGVWWIRYTTLQGKRRAESVGQYEAAVNIYTERMDAVRAGRLEPVPHRRGMLFETLVADALKFSQGSHKDKKNFKQRVEAALPVFGRRVAESITPADLRDWLTDMAEDNVWSNGTFNRYKAALSKVFKLAVAELKVSSNPARLVPQRKESMGRVRYLTDPEEARLRQALSGRPYAVPQLDVALHTGMRKGEQFTVTPDQVDLEKKFIYLTDSKNGSDRFVQLNTIAMRTMKEVLAAHKKRGLPSEATLFVSGRKEPMRDPREWFDAACEEAKIEGVTWHILRHTFGSRLVMAGVPLSEVSDLMGHKTLAMTRRYAHLAPAHKLNALERLVPKGTGKRAVKKEHS